MDDRLARLREELGAIGLFDEEYRQKKFHDQSDDLAYRARQERRREIMREIGRLNAELFSTRRNHRMITLLTARSER